MPPPREGAGTKGGDAWYRDLLGSLAGVKLRLLLVVLLVVASAAFVGSFLLGRGHGPWSSFFSGLAKLVADASLSSAASCSSARTWPPPTRSPPVSWGSRPC